MKIGQQNEELYPIGMVAKLFKISVATIRMYENEGLLIPHKSKGQHRLYSDFDLQRIRCIRQMITDKGLNIAGIRMMLSAIPCWELKPCTAADCAVCDAYHSSDTPCWLVENKGPACQNTECRQCPVYLQSAHCNSIKSILKKFWRSQPHDETI